MNGEKRRLFRDAWRLSVPYWRSDEKGWAWGLLAAVTALNLSTVYLSVRFNFWRNDFYNAIQNLDEHAFFYQLMIFSILAAIFIAVAVYQTYLQQMLQIRWRRWLTRRYLEAWLDERSYYRMQLAGPGTDNPDQRIQDDLDRFTVQTLGLTLGVLNSVVTLFSFLVILWSLSGSLAIPLGPMGSVVIPGYMFWVALVYSVAGTWLTYKIGRPLVGLNFMQQRFEADFRFSLVRLRENTESIALYGGEAREYGNFTDRFGRVVGNFWTIMKRVKTLNWFTNGYGQIAVIFPYRRGLAALLREADPIGRPDADRRGVRPGAGLALLHRQFLYRHRAVAIGDRAARHVRGAHPRDSRRRARAATDRDRARGKRPRGRSARPRPAGRHAAPARRDIRRRGGRGGADRGPDRRRQEHAVARARRHLAVRPRPHPHRRGGDAVPAAAALSAARHAQGGAALSAALGRHRRCAPQGGARYGGIERAQAAARRRRELGREPLDRRAAAPGLRRILLVRPAIVFLDEATSALDEPAEAELYRLLRAAPWRPTVVSVGHRSTLRPFHDSVADIARFGAREAALAPAAD